MNISRTNINSFQGSVEDGSATIPSISFNRDTSTGFYSLNSGIGFSVQGTQRLALTSANLTTSNVELYVNNGNVRAVGFGFVGDETTGFIRAASSNIAIVTGGNLKLAIDNSTILPQIPIRAQDGTASAPSYSFTSGTGTGIYRSTGLLGFSISGASQLTLTNTSATFGVAIRPDDGSQTNPSYAFSNELSTGLYRISAGNLGITCSGNNVCNISPTLTQLTLGTLSVPNQPFQNRAGGFTMSIPNNTDTTLTSIYAGASVSQGTGISYASGVYTVSNPGIYIIQASGYWSANATGDRQVFVYHNSVSKNQQQQIASSTNIGYFNYYTVLRCSANDTISIRVYQNSGGALNITGGGANGSFTIYRMS